MQVELSRTEWKSRRLFVATPMYGGMCTAQFTTSMIMLQKLCHAFDIELKLSVVWNESLITRARNKLASLFIESDFTHLMFVDADIGFDPSDVVCLLGAVGDNSGYDVLAGSYPIKRIDWDQVRSAALKGTPDLSASGNLFVSKPPIATPFDLNQDIVPVDYAGTGFMMIDKRVFAAIQRTHPDDFYLSDFSLAGANGDDGKQIHMYFQSAIDHDTKSYLPEDYWFCKRAKEVGAKIGICPDIKLTHIGNHAFSGSIRST